MDGAGKEFSRSIQRIDFGKGDRSDHSGKDRGQKMAGFFALFFLAGADVFSFFGLHNLQRFDGNPLAFGKSESGLGGLTLFVKGDALGRAGDSRNLRFLSRGDPVASRPGAGVFPWP